MEKKKGIIITIVVVLLLLVVGVTYAFFTYESGTKSDIVTGQIYMNYEETSTISLTGVFPETKEQALSRNDENGVFEFTITGRNTSKYPVYYEIDLLEGGVMTGKTEQSTKILPEHVMIYLEKDGVPVIEGKTYADWNNKPIYVETVPAGITSNIEHKYTLRMWVSDKITISDTDPNADYTTTEWNDAYTSLKVRVVGDFEEKELYPKLVKTIETNLATYLQAADAEGNRYLKGSNTQVNNYVWYSGKLWRIVAINSDNTIKLVTQGNMTTIAWSIERETVDGTTTYNTVYENSQIHNWLKNEFLPTIEPSVLADSTWDYTTYGTATATKAPATAYVENEKVGLLTIYDYYKAGSASSFLNNGYYWWTMSPQTDGSYVWYVDNYGNANNLSPTYSTGVRPSVNLKSDIQIMGGSGTKSNPYVIGGDKDTGVTTELISNRISGEYIKFNDVLYRIVGVEEINGQTLTKITMADYSLNGNTLTTSLAYAPSSVSSSLRRIYSPTYGIGLYLEEWYQADSTSETYSTIYIKDNYKAMIATSGENGDNVVWYMGPTTGTGYDYTLSKTGTPVSATIGLGYYGEMFSSPFGDGYNSSIYTWLMTIYSSTHVWHVQLYGTAGDGYTTSSNGVRPSMYLKSGVKIVSGSGMPHDPYQITM